jgi:DNA-binding NarL/FixJ family response regulator
MRNLIGHWDDFEVVGEAATGLEAVEKARELMPDVILMDIAMPQMNGIEAAQKISREMPSIRIVMLTMSGEDDNLFRSIKGGAQGYILKDTPSKRLHDQLRGVMRGEAPLSGAVASKILMEFTHPTEDSNAHINLGVEKLTEREKKVLELVALGKTNPEIAEELYLSENTIKKHIHNILTKLQLKNRVEAAIYAMNNGYLVS